MTHQLAALAEVRTILSVAQGRVVHDGAQNVLEVMFDDLVYYKEIDIEVAEFNAAEDYLEARGE